MNIFKMHKIVAATLALGVILSANALTAAQPVQSAQPPKASAVKSADVVAAKLGGDPVGPSLADLEALNRKAEVATAERTFKERMSAGQSSEAPVVLAPPKVDTRVLMAAPPAPIVPASGAKLVAVIVVGGAPLADLVLPSGARYMAKQGEVLPGGWRVAAADMNGVVVEQLMGGAKEVLPRFTPSAGSPNGVPPMPVIVPAELRDRLMRMPPSGLQQDNTGPRPDSTAMSSQVPPPSR